MRWHLLGLLIFLAGCGSETALFLGDVSYGFAYVEDHGSLLLREGYEYPLDAIRPLMEDSDEVIINLETSITESTSILMPKNFIHKDRPDTAAAYARHGVTAASLANNHAYDYGKIGFDDTVRYLSGSGIVSFGYGTPYEFTLDDEPYAVFGLFETRTDYDAFGYYEHVTRYEAGLEEIRTYDSSHPQATIIAYPHWGKNYKAVRDIERGLAQELIDAGADIIIGHGSHAAQDITRVSGKLVFYGLGNGMFLSSGRYSEYNLTGLSYLVRLSHSGVKVYPTFTNNVKTDYQPRPVTEEEFKQFIREVTITVDYKTEQDNLGYYLLITP